MIDIRRLKKKPKKSNKLTKFVEILIERGVNINKTSNYGYTAMEIAYKKKQFKFISFVLKNKLDIVNKTIIKFLQGSSLYLIRLLAKYGYRIDLKDDDNRTALIHACIN